MMAEPQWTLMRPHHAHRQQPDDKTARCEPIWIYQDQLNIDECTRSWPFVHIHIRASVHAARERARAGILRLKFEHLSAIVFSVESRCECARTNATNGEHILRRRYVSSFVAREARATTIWMIWCDNGAEFMPKLSNPTKKHTKTEHKNENKIRKKQTHTHTRTCSSWARISLCLVLRFQPFVAICVRVFVCVRALFEHFGASIPIYLYCALLTHSPSLCSVHAVVFIIQRLCSCCGGFLSSVFARFFSLFIWNFDVRLSNAFP